MNEDMDNRSGAPFCTTGCSGTFSYRTRANVLKQQRDLLEAERLRLCDELYAKRAIKQHEEDIAHITEENKRLQRELRGETA